MKPEFPGPEQDDLLRPRLTDMIDMRHELVKLGLLNDWEFFETEWTTAVYIAGARRGITPGLRRDLRRRRVIEPIIDHMKTDRRTARLALKGSLLERVTPERKRKMPRDLNFYVSAVARLGGYLDRTSDASPGTTVIWRGLSRLADLAEGARLSQIPPSLTYGHL